MPDTALVLARNLKQVTEPLVTSRPVFSGQVTEAESGVCQLEAGLLLSRPLVDSMLADMEWCYRWAPALMTNNIKLNLVFQKQDQLRPVTQPSKLHLSFIQGRRRYTETEIKKYMSSAR